MYAGKAHIYSRPCMLKSLLTQLVLGVESKISTCLLAQVAAEAAGFGAALAMDFATNTVEQNERERASQLRLVIERLGPAYVKVCVGVVSVCAFMCVFVCVCEHLYV